MPNQPLFTPYRMGDLDLPNRIVMAPLTRQDEATQKESVSGLPKCVPNRMITCPRPCRRSITRSVRCLRASG